MKVDANDVRRKLRDRGMLERIKTQQFQWAPTVGLHDSNGLEFTEYVLDVSAAKFFVEAKKIGKEAAVWCKDRSIRIGRVPDERWGEVNSYPKALLRHIFKLYGKQYANI